MTGALHLIQRSRSACFTEVPSRLTYLSALVIFSSHYDCIVHAYVVMPNHVHVLLTALTLESAASLASHLSSSLEERLDLDIRPIHARRYLLGCMRYIELNPVRAHMIERPDEYRWSSHRANALGYKDPAVTPHALYYSLGRSAEERRRVYARFIERNHFGAAVSP
jgi:putative transposase